jgi:NTP pyrophosphatase (non-canonical NTP hydrolase)
LDDNTAIAELRAKVSKFRDARGWLKFNNPKDLSIALSIEAAELQELFLWKDAEEVTRLQMDRKQISRVRDEMGDVAIYLLSLSDVLGVDLTEAILDKLKKNEKKYPVEKFKGSNRKYDEA